MNFLGRLVVFLEGNISQFESAMNRAEKLSYDAAKKIEASLTKADAAMIGFAAGAGQQLVQNLGRSLESAYTSTVKLAASLDDMAEKTGGSVERLSGFVQVAKIGGHEVGALEVGLTKLARGMAGADDETKGAGKALEFLGVKAKDSAGNMRATDEVMADVAKSLSRYADGAGKSAIAQELFGKSGAQLLPFLKDMAEYGDKVGKITAEQAARAEEYEKALGRLALAKQEVVQAVALELLPAMTAVVEVMYKAHVESQKAAGSLSAMAQDGTVRTWAENAALALATLVDNVKLTMATLSAIGESMKVVFADMMVGLAALGKMVPVIGPALFEKALAERNRVLEAAGKEWEALLNRDVNATRRSVEDQLRLQKLLADAYAGKFDDARDRAARGAGKPVLNWSSGGTAKPEKDLADAVRTLNELRGKALGIDAAYFSGFEKLTKAYQAGQLPLDEYREAVQDLLLQHTVAGKEMMKLRNAHDLTREAYEKSLDASRAMVEGMEAEVAALALTNTEREISLRLRELEHKGIRQGSDDYNELAARIRAAVEAKERFAQTMSIWDELSNRVAGFAQALTGGVTKGLQYAIQEAKRFGMEILSIFVKRYVLNVGASLTGNPALATAAGQVGQGSLAGSIIGNAGGMLASGLNIVGLGSASQFVGGATGAIMGPALPGSALAAGQGLGGMLSMAGPYIAAIAAAAILYSRFKDAGENWKGRLGFGSGAQAYTTEGIFGREGFQYLAGNDAVNRSIQSFMASTGGLDRQIARRLTSGQIGSISNRLLGYNTSGTRADGQPAEFAFGKGDETAAAQLTLEYLKQKYGAVFDEIDSGFAAFIRGYTGKSEDLLKAIGEFVGVLDGLDQIGIKGLNLDALKGFQKDGEELTATFGRIAQSWSAYQEAFLTEGEKIGLMQDQLVKGFADLGIEMPGSIEDFKKLVGGIDLSTEAGRKLWEGLMALAPAFASVANASAQLLDQFKQIAAQRNPALARIFAEQDLETTVKQFMSRNTWTNGKDWRYVAGQIGLITSYAGGAADFAGYSPEDQALILKILGITRTLDGLGNAADGAATALSGVGTNAGAAANDWLNIKMSLWDYLKGLYTNPQLSPLDPSQQLDTLKGRFTTMLAQANAGNVGAGQGLAGLIEQILGAGRAMYASGPGYVELFNWVTGLAGDFVQPGGGQDLQRSLLDQAKAQTVELGEVRVLLQGIFERLGDNTAVIEDATLKSGENVAQSIKAAGLETARR